MADVKVSEHKAAVGQECDNPLCSYCTFWKKAAAARAQGQPVTWGDPEGPRAVTIEHSVNGLPITIQVKKAAAKVRVEKETEDEILLVIELK